MGMPLMSVSGMFVLGDESGGDGRVVGGLQCMAIPESLMERPLLKSEESVNDYLTKLLPTAKETTADISRKLN